MGKIEELACKHGHPGHCSECDEELSEIAAWAGRLGPAAIRSVRWWEQKMAPRYPGAEPSINKLLEEVEELKGDPDDSIEGADIFIALVIYAYRKGWDLPGDVQAKMVVNEARVWGDPDANGTVRHVSKCDGSLCRNVWADVPIGTSYRLVRRHSADCSVHEVSRTSAEAAP